MQTPCARAPATRKVKASVKTVAPTQHAEHTQTSKRAQTFEIGEPRPFFLFRYEVKTEGDAFMVAFTSPSDAVLFGAELQTDLVDYPWPPWLLEDSEVQDLVGAVYPPAAPAAAAGDAAAASVLPLPQPVAAATNGRGTHSGGGGGDSAAALAEGWGSGMQPPGAAMLKRGSLRTAVNGLGVLAGEVRTPTPFKTSTTGSGWCRETKQAEVLPR
jgi:class 3 adenylate cyclase